MIQNKKKNENSHQWLLNWQISISNPSYRTPRPNLLFKFIREYEQVGTIIETVIPTIGQSLLTTAWRGCADRFFRIFFLPSQIRALKKFWNTITQKCEFHLLPANQQSGTTEWIDLVSIRWFDISYPYRSIGSHYSAFFAITPSNNGSRWDYFHKNQKTNEEKSTNDWIAIKSGSHEFLNPLGREASLSLHSPRSLRPGFPLVATLAVKMALPDKSSKIWRGRW
jgi:hypothetical protein